MNLKVPRALAFASVLLAPSISAAAHTASPPPSYVATNVEVDASALEGGGSTMEKSLASLARNEVAAAVARDLKAKQVPLSERKAEATLRVALRWKSYETSHYAITVEVLREGRSQVVLEDDCKLCDEDEVAQRVAAKVPALLPYLAEQAEPAVDAEDEVEPDEEVGPKPAGSEREPSSGGNVDGDDYRRVGVAGYVGIASMGIGLVTAVAGIPMLLERPTTRYRPGDDYVLETLDRVPLGASLMGIGGTLLVTGAVLLTVDQVVLRKKRVRRSAAVGFLPSISPRGARVALTVRF